jgi:hypothetical protein
MNTSQNDVLNEILNIKYSQQNNQVINNIVSNDKRIILEDDFDEVDRDLENNENSNEENDNDDYDEANENSENEDFNLNKNNQTFNEKILSIENIDYDEDYIIINSNNIEYLIKIKYRNLINIGEKIRISQSKYITHENVRLVFITKFKKILQKKKYWEPSHKKRKIIPKNRFSPSPKKKKLNTNSIKKFTFNL